MNKFELVATVSKYAAVTACVLLVGHFGLRVSFDKNHRVVNSGHNSQ